MDLSTQQAWLLRNGSVSYGPVPVATGKASAPTVPGTFAVFWKDLHHRSSEFHNAPMPYSVFFNGGDAFHQDSVKVLSNGCVHLTQSAAQTFYNTLHVGDVVQGKSTADLGPAQGCAIPAARTMPTTPTPIQKTLRTV